MRDYEYDYIIVGAGTAGCVLAARLSENPHARVLLIEAGGSDKGLLTKIPLLAFMASANAARNWSYVTEPIPELGGRRQTWNQGRLIGGSSSINGMVYMRGHPKEYDEWRQIAGEGWSFDALLPYFKKSESHSRGAGPWHGGSGPVKVRPSNLQLPICGAFLQAIEASGLPVVEDLNAGVKQGFGRFDTNIDRGIRASAARAYLYPALKRKNLKVMENAFALRLIIESRRARGVEVQYEGKRASFRASEELILCSGALNTPSLLMISGIGPANHLAQLGIAVVVDAPEVGKNLRNHPAYVQQYHCTDPVTAYSYMSPLAGTKACLEYIFRRRGPFAESFPSLGGFLCSDSSAEVADTIVVMTPSLTERASGSVQRWQEFVPNEHGFSIAISLGRPYSTGEIRLQSAIPGEAPRIFPNYFSDPRDMSVLVRSIQSVLGVMRKRCIAQYIDMQRDRDNFDDSTRTIEQKVRGGAGSLSHPSGTCRMGSDVHAVVDSELRVNGIAGLRVADNSIIPLALNSGTHALALMIGEKASNFITKAKDAIHDGPLQ